MPSVHTVSSHSEFMALLELYSGWDKVESQLGVACTRSSQGAADSLWLTSTISVRLTEHRNTDKRFERSLACRAAVAVAPLRLSNCEAGSVCCTATEMMRANDLAVFNQLNHSLSACLSARLCAGPVRLSICLSVLAPFRECSGVDAGRLAPSVAVAFCPAWRGVAHLSLQCHVCQCCPFSQSRRRFIRLVYGQVCWPLWQHQRRHQNNQKSRAKSTTAVGQHCWILTTSGWSTKHQYKRPTDEATVTDDAQWCLLSLSLSRRHYHQFHLVVFSCCTYVRTYMRTYDPRPNAYPTFVLVPRSRPA